MLALSPVWHGRALAVRRLANFVLQTLVIHPALLFFLLFLKISMDAGSGGQMLLNSAENLVRDAPASQVWGCHPSPKPMPPDLSGTAKKGSTEKFLELKPAPVPVLCKRGATTTTSRIRKCNSSRPRLMIPRVSIISTQTAPPGVRNSAGWLTTAISV